MSLITIGLNHQTAPVEIREKVVFAPEHIQSALKELIDLPGTREAAILSTCNRTELYCKLQAPDHTHQVIEWLSDYHHTADQELKPYLYQHVENEAVRHTIRVASGLDSMVVGEPQILGQFKNAFRTANETGTLGKHLRRLFQHAFAVAKHVRTDTEIGANPVSVAFAAISLAKQIFGDLSNQRALLIGAGETIELAARHLVGNGLKSAIVANRTPQRAAALAAKIGAIAIGLPQIPEVLPDVDIVIASTASPLPILGKGTVESALRQRRHRPLFMVDLAVPRDIEAEVSHLRDVYLYTVDDLEQVIQDNIAQRQEAAGKAEEMVVLHTEEFMGWLRAQSVVDMIRCYRERAEDMRDETIEKALHRLQRGDSPESVIAYLAETLTKKLIHEPTHALDQAARAGHQEVVEAAFELLHLPRKPNKPT